MKMHVNVILSAEHAARTPADDVANAKRTNALHAALHERGIAFLPARGCYKGVEERAVVTLIEDSDDYEWLLEHAFTECHQESVLVLDDNMIARLHYANGAVERLGVMEKVPEWIARSKDGWTRVPRPLDVLAPHDYWIVNRDLMMNMDGIALLRK